MLLMVKQHHVIHCAQFSNVSLIFSILARLNIRHYQRVLTLEPSLYPRTGKYTDPTRAMHDFKVLNGMVISLLSWHNVGRGRMGWREIGTVSTIMMTINVVVLCRSPYYFWARYLMPIIVLQFQKLFLFLTAIARPSPGGEGVPVELHQLKKIERETDFICMLNIIYNVR